MTFTTYRNHIRKTKMGDTVDITASAVNGRVHVPASLVNAQHCASRIQNITCTKKIASNKQLNPQNGTSFAM